MTEGTNYRIEKDCLGEVKIPVHALYGPQTQRAVENFPISGKLPYPMFVRAMVLVKKAAAIVNAGLGYLPVEIGQAITQVADEILDGKFMDQFVVDPFQAGAGTSHNMNANEVLANRASQLLAETGIMVSVHPNDHVNMSQSTNDTIPTAIRVGCMILLDDLLVELALLRDALGEKAEEFDPIVKSGRTHLQDAVPIRLGQEFHGYRTAVDRDMQRLTDCQKGLRRLGIGGTATGTGINADVRYHQELIKAISSETNIEFIECDDLVEAMQSMADFADLSGNLRTMAITLTKIANDIRLLASGPTTGLAEIKLTPVQPGSSIMPGKVNPVMAEMLNMAMYHVMGCDSTVALAAQAGQLELNVMMPVIAHNLFEILTISTGAIRAFTDKCVVSISPNREMIDFWLERNPIIVTALNPLIGYQAGAELVKAALKECKSIRQTALEEAQSGKLIHIRTGEKITPDEIEKSLFDLRSLTEGGIAGTEG
ncbi:MAG: aspartate ammonia-lyase [Anaerolineales bacterium]|nr:aspartate ammonia-lyase [Anaerolineales bacterium]